MNKSSRYQLISIICGILFLVFIGIRINVGYYAVHPEENPNPPAQWPVYASWTCFALFVLFNILYRRQKGKEKNKPE